MEDTMLELLDICREKELYCMHNNVDLIGSALKSILLSINLKSQHLDKEKQEVENIVEQSPKRKARLTNCLENFKVIHNESSISLNNSSQISSVIVIAPVLPTEEPEYSLSMRDEHLSTTSEMESDEIIKSSVENLVPIPSEYEGILDDTCDVLVFKDYSTLKDHCEILSNSSDDDTSSDDNSFEDINFIEASLPDSELVILKKVNDVDQKEKEIDLEDILQIQDVILREKLLSINRLIANIEFLNYNLTPDHVLKSSSSFPIPVMDSDSFFEKSSTPLSYSDSSLPEFETFSDHTVETRNGSTTTHANNSLPEYDLFYFEIEPDQGRLTSVVMDNISDDSTNDPLLEAVDLFLVSDNSIPPGIENINNDSEGDIHFLEELLSNDSIPLHENESSNFDHHNDPSFPRPPPEPPDVEVFFDFEPDSGELISAVMNNINELNEDEFFDPGEGRIVKIKSDLNAGEITAAHINVNTALRNTNMELTVVLVVLDSAKKSGVTD
nr:hypothetical protein [Tanacetum cinerariifolium]